MDEFARPSGRLDSCGGWMCPQFRTQSEVDSVAEQVENLVLTHPGIRASERCRLQRSSDPGRFGVLLPFQLLSFANAFHQERLKELLRLA